MAATRAPTPPRHGETLAQTETVEARLRSDGVAVAWIDVPGRPLNVLTDALGRDLPAVLEQVEATPGVRALVIASGKASGFLAGADVARLAACASEAEALELSARAQALMERVERARVACVAAIHGACLGGGLELVLACGARVASDDIDTVLGAPEVRLGLLPGAGGTVRLPRAIGVRAALELMLTGKQVGARDARRRGLLDEVVPRWVLVEAAAARALRLAERGERAPGAWARLVSALDPRGWVRWALEDTRAGRRLLFDKARARAERTARGHYPAPGAILDVVRAGLEQGREAGLAAERAAFARLWSTSASHRLVELFLGTKRLEREADELAAAHGGAEVRRVSVVGAGLMGGGIAAASALGGHLVRLRDIDAQALARGLDAVGDVLDARVRRGRLRRADAQRARHRVTGTTGEHGLAAADLVIEAVPEDAALKRRVFAALEAHADPSLVLATNTSSIPLARLGQDLERPERLVGMHYFSPVDKMPLIEIVRGERTAPDVLAAALAVGRAQGKTPVVVRDGPGFYTTRILAPYLVEAVALLEEGVPPRAIDEALVAFGFPVGPLQVADEVGIDVASKIAGVLHEALGARMAPPAALETLLAEGRAGRKSGAGFYRYDDGERRDDARRVLAAIGAGASRAAPDPAAIAARCVLRLVDEAVRCLDEGVLASAADGDLAAVLGLGFPPFRGGPFRYVDDEGAGVIVARLQTLAERHGERFAPGARLLAMAADPSRRFHAADA